MSQSVRLVFTSLIVTWLNVSYATETFSVTDLLLEARVAVSELKRDHQWRLLNRIAKAEAKSGDPSKAQHTLNHLKAVIELYSWELREIAITEAIIGNIDEAKKTMIKMQGDSGAVRIVEELASSNNLQAALELSRIIKGEIFPSVSLGDLYTVHALRFIGVHQAKVGHLADAMKTRYAIVSLSSKPSIAEIAVLAAIAVQQASFSKYSAKKTLSTAFKRAKALPLRIPVSDKPEAFSLIASAWAQIGSEQNALRMIKFIGQGSQARRATLEAAYAAAQAGQKAVSLGLMQHVNTDIEVDKYASFHPLGLVISTYLVLGDIDSALRSVPLLANVCAASAKAVSEIAQAQANEGDYRSALEAVTRIATFSEPGIVLTKLRALAQIAARQAQDGNFDAARDTANLIMKIPDDKPGERSHACALQRGYDPAAGAKTDWQGGYRPWNRSVAYSSIAEAMASAGFIDEVVEWARKETSALDKAQIFIGGAEGLLISQTLQ